MEKGECDSSTFRCMVYKKTLNRSNRILKNINYHLLIRNEKSLFINDNSIDTLSTKEKIAINFYAPTIVYNNGINILSKKKYQGTEYLISYDSVDYDWVIDKKKKKNILGYTCFFATCSIKNISSNKDEILYAWYTPDIKSKKGPSKYYGLPGLILEIRSLGSFLNKKIECKFMASDIKYNKKNIKIEKPSGKLITKNEYDGIVINNMIKD